MPVRFFLFITSIFLFCSCKQNNQSFLISAHRGYSAKAPENTLAAFREAIDAGANYFECDVRVIKDDSLVLMHDATINRTTSGKGNLSDINFRDLRKLNAGYHARFGNKFKTEKVPTLYEALHLAKGKIKVEIEIKEAALADKIIELVRRCEMEDEVSVISFYFNAIKRVKEIAPEISVKYLRGEKWGIDEIDQLVAIGAEYIGPSGIPTPEQIELAHQNGIRIISYTINTSEQIEQAVEAGVNGIATDYPLRAYRIRGRVKVPQKKMLANWKLGRGNNNRKIKDYSGCNHHISIPQNYVTAEFDGENGMVFLDEDDYLEVKPSAILNQKFDAISLLARVRMDRLPSELKMEWSPIYDSDEDCYVLYADKSMKQVNFKIVTNEGVQRVGIPERLLQTGKWYTILGTYNGSFMRIYLDGKLISEAPIEGKITGIQEAKIGKNGNGDQFFEGAMSQLMIWNYAIAQNNALVVSNSIKAIETENRSLAHMLMNKLMKD